ncbi:hypothetical protein BgiBS90_004882, partial [Biomphalaria glabrata]
MRLEFLFQICMFCVCSSISSKNVCTFTVEDTIVFVWEKDQLSPLEFQLSLCTLRCNGTDIVDVEKERNQSLSQYECNYCHCRKPSCERSDTCCPDISAARPTPLLAARKRDPENTIENFERKYPQETKIRLELGCFMNKKPFAIKSTCLSDYKNNDTVEYLCEADHLTEEQSLETYIKVLDNSTNVVYKNKFCALCNRVLQ